MGELTLENMNELWDQVYESSNYKDSDAVIYYGELTTWGWLRMKMRIEEKLNKPFNY